MDVKTTLNGYLKNGHQSRSIINMDNPAKSSGPPTALVEATVFDGRASSEEFSLDKHSFELAVHPTSLSTTDFFEENEEKIKSSYYMEMADLMKKVTGAEYVHVMHHQVRSVAKQTAGAGKQVHGKVEGYAHGIHSDSCPISSDQQFRDILASIPDKDLAERCKRGRFLYLNAWRNISDEPVMQNPLAVLDENSLIKPDDYVVGDLIYPTFKLQQYRLDSRHADKHRWYYFSKQRKEEVLLFKQYDSDTALSGRVCFHTAFHLPNVPSDAPVRQSIECRAFCFFPDHKPNTCPNVDAPERDVESMGKKLLLAFETSYTWPVQFQTWLRYSSHKTAVDAMVKDEGNYQGLKNADEEFKEQVKAWLFEHDVSEVIDGAIAKMPKTSWKKKAWNGLKVLSFPASMVFLGVALGWWIKSKQSK